MAGKKTKNKAQKNPSDMQAMHKRDYIARLKQICDQLAGAGWFEMLPKGDIDLIYEKRYPPIIFRPAPGQVINEKRWDHYYQGIKMLLDGPIITVNGNNVPMRTILSEGFCLLHFIDMISADRFPGARNLREAFRGHLPSSQHHHKEITDNFFYLLFLIDVRNGNYYDGFFLTDTTPTNIGNVPLRSNTILVYHFKTAKASISIDGRKREITPISRPVPRDITLQVTIKPSTIGFVTPSDEPLPLYIQQHALQRLDERLGLLPDIVHGHLFFTLYQQPVTYAKEPDHSLIAFTIHGYKVGYLLTTLHSDKLVIRSFLFMTNDGTPEGRKLRKLTQLQKYDKKYLGIDKLSTFNAYHIEKDEALSALFREAGCGSLLEAGYMEAISSAYTPSGDTAMLHKFLASSNYFKNLKVQGDPPNAK